MELRINEPCHEDWDQMKLGMDSRHCDSCVKSVVDFTQMDRGQIITYLLMRPNEQVCGRMHRSQMDFRHEDVPLIIEAIQKHRPANAFMILALVTLTLASCSQPNGSAPTTKKDKTVLVDKDTLHHDQPDMGEIEMGKTTVHDRITADTIVKSPPVCPEPLMGMLVVDPIDPIDLGDIEMPMPPPPPPKEKDNAPKTFVEVMPEYVGGMDAMMAFIKANLRFTDEMKETNLEVTVYLRMVVETDGSLSGIEVLRGVAGSDRFEKEAVRLVKSMPKWTPGKDRGQVCRSYMSLPIRFKL